jgi:hypothetical protein
MSPNTRRLRRSLILVSLFLLLLQVVAIFRGLPVAISGRSDFLASYTAGYMIRLGDARELYQLEVAQRYERNLVGREDTTARFDGLPYEALLYVPLSLLRFRDAYVAFFFANLVLLALSIWMLSPYLTRLAAAWTWLPIAVFFCFLPVALALTQGHDSILLLTLMLASAVSFYKGRDLFAGLFLGLTLFRLEWAIVMVTLFFAWRCWRILSGFAIASAGCALVSLWVTSPAALKSYGREAVSWAAQSPPQVSRFTSMANLRCLIQAITHLVSSSGLTLPFAAICSFILVIWAATRPPNFALAALVTLLAMTHGSTCDIVLLILPLSMVMDARIGAAAGNQLAARNLAGILFIGPTLLFFAGWSYCPLVLLMVALLVPLRSTSSGPPPKPISWFVPQNS